MMNNFEYPERHRHGGVVILCLLTLGLCGWIAYGNFTLQKEVHSLQEQNAVILGKLDSLKMITPPSPAKSSTKSNNAGKKGSSSSSASSKAKSSSSDDEEMTLLDWMAIEMQRQFIADSEERQQREAAQKTTVEFSYRMEDRYTKSTSMPDKLSDTPGKVVVDIYIDYSGDVLKTAVNPATTISDEEIIESCRKAALKTSFNYTSSSNYNEQQKGTITYTFIAKKK